MNDDTVPTEAAKPQFTPGPWSRDEDSVFIFGPNMEMIAQIRGTGENLPERANADLLAAAPKMYEALKLAFAELQKEHGSNSDPTCDCTLCKHINDVLREARGEK